MTVEINSEFVLNGRGQIDPSPPTSLTRDATDHPGDGSMGGDPISLPQLLVHPA